MSFALLFCVPDGTKIGKCREPQLFMDMEGGLTN